MNVLKTKVVKAHMVVSNRHLESLKMYHQMSVDQLEYYASTYRLIESHVANATRLMLLYGIPLPNEAQQAEVRSSSSGFMGNVHCSS